VDVTPISQSGPDPLLAKPDRTEPSAILYWITASAVVNSVYGIVKPRLWRLEVGDQLDPGGMLRRTAGLSLTLSDGST
jgi:hypothetical protein